MTESVTYVTQSRFYSPAFNAAIFDGPIRIYFAQYQESQALKLYFNLQERFSEVRTQARGIFRQRGRNIFVMLYPTPDAFDLSFGADSVEGESLSAESPDVGGHTGAVRDGVEHSGIRSSVQVPTMSGGVEAHIIACERLGSDFVLGVRGPLGDDALERVCLEMDRIVQFEQIEQLEHAEKIKQAVSLNQ